MLEPASSTPPAFLASPALAVQEHLPPIDERRGAYRVRYARTTRDIEDCCRMRYEVFNLELGEGLSASLETGLDTDRFDEQCNHLMVIEEATGSVIGTYRMQTAGMARAAAGFYSAAEFDLSGIPDEIRENGIELGRASILKEHRNKIVLFLLWRGLMAFLVWNDKRYLFGCSSLTSQDPCEGLWAYDHLRREGHVQDEWLCPTLPAYVCESDSYSGNQAPYPIPRLFSTYLRHSAKVCSPPALDRFFGTIDFLTLLDKQKFDRRLAAVFALGLPRR